MGRHVDCTTHARAHGNLLNRSTPDTTRSARYSSSAVASSSTQASASTSQPGRSAPAALMQFCRNRGDAGNDVGGKTALVAWERERERGRPRWAGTYLCRQDLAVLHGALGALQERLLEGAVGVKHVVAHVLARRVERVAVEGQAAVVRAREAAPDVVHPLRRRAGTHAGGKSERGRKQRGRSGRGREGKGREGRAWQGAPC